MLVNEERMHIKGPSGMLEIGHCQGAADNNTYVIVCHPHPLHGGTMENKVVTTLFKTATTLGFHTVRFNFRGVGKSEGDHDEGVGETEDLMAVTHWIIGQQPTAKIMLAGFSFGSMVAYNACQRYDYDRLICVAPSVTKSMFNSKEPTCPYVVIMGSHDELIASSVVRQWVAERSHRPRYLEISDASHFFHGKLLQLREHFSSLLSNK